MYAWLGVMRVFCFFGGGKVIFVYILRVVSFWERGLSCCFGSEESSLGFSSFLRGGVEGLL